VRFGEKKRSKKSLRRKVSEGRGESSRRKKGRLTKGKADYRLFFGGKKKKSFPPKGEELKRTAASFSQKPASFPKKARLLPRVQVINGKKKTCSILTEENAKGCISSSALTTPRREKNCLEEKSNILEALTKGAKPYPV